MSGRASTTVVVPELVAHRGYPRHYPENTLVGIEAAIRAGARYVEVDVQLTRDQVPVLFHDPDLGRICNASGAVSELDFEELRRLRASEFDRFGYRYAQVRIAALAELAELLKRHPAVTAFVELKPEAIARFGRLTVLSRVRRELEAVRPQCVIISYDFEALAAARRDWTIGAVIDRWRERRRAITQGLRPEYLFCNVHGLPRFGRLRVGDSRLVVFEVADPALALRLARRGVQLIETFAVGEMRAPSSWRPPLPMSAAYDLVIVGAGIHGAGVAQAAAAAGYSALVLEQTAVAAGTSSRSSKLIHGGLRYLESGQFRLVREALAERERLLALAPDLVERVAFYIPVYKTTARRPWTIRAGLCLYALLAGLERHSLFAAVPRRQWATLDGLETRGLQAVFRYFDAQTDDAALTRAVMRSAERLGAALACPARFAGAQRLAEGFEVRYTASGREECCFARTLVNASGPWAERVLEAIAPPPARLAMELVQGAHIVMEGEIGRGVYYVESPSDRRALFVMPWRGAILVGTTETPFAGDPALVQPLPREIDYLRTSFLHYFPARGGKILDAFAGLRVLPKGDTPVFHRPRETVLHADPCGRLVTVYGGKLTTYRRTAARVLRLLRRSLPPRTPRADTARIPLEDTGNLRTR